MIQNKWNGLSIDATMDVLSCTRSYVYKLIRRNEVAVIEDCYPVRISIESIISKIRRLYPWLVDNCLTGLDYHLKQKAIHQY